MPCGRRVVIAGRERFDIRWTLSGDAKVGIWSPMIPHAPLRRILFVTISGCLLGGLLLYFEHGMFVVGAFMGGSIGAAGPTVAGGTLFVPSGYIGVRNGMPGNVLLAFAMPKE